MTSGYIVGAKGRFIPASSSDSSEVPQSLFLPFPLLIDRDIILHPPLISHLLQNSLKIIYNILTKPSASSSNIPGYTSCSPEDLNCHLNCKYVLSNDATQTSNISHEHLSISVFKLFLHPTPFFFYNGFMKYIVPFQKCGYTGCQYVTCPSVSSWY